ncbi:unnamed protein product [Brassica oleracea var. botrytis]
MWTQEQVRSNRTKMFVGKYQSSDSHHVWGCWTSQALYTWHMSTSMVFHHDSSSCV